MSRYAYFELIVVTVSYFQFFFSSFFLISHFTKINAFTQLE